MTMYDINVLTLAAQKKLDFEKDSVVPASSQYMFAAGVAFALYGLATGSPSTTSPSVLKSQIDAKKQELASVEEKIKALSFKLGEAKAGE